MRRLAAIAATIALALAGCGPTADEIARKQATETATADAKAKSAALIAAAEEKQIALKPQRDKILRQLKAEPKIKDVAWLDENHNSLLVGVLPDKIKGDGYAEYLCQRLSEHKLYGGIVRIMDVTAAMQNNWKEIGRANCQTEDQAATPTQWVDFTKTDKSSKKAKQ